MLCGPHHLSRGRINQARFQGHDDAPRMERRHVSLPAPDFNIEDAAFKLTTSGQISRLLWATGRLVAYGRRHRLRRHDPEAAPFELRTRLCREDIRHGDASRTGSIWIQK